MVFIDKTLTDRKVPAFNSKYIALDGVQSPKQDNMRVRFSAGQTRPMDKCTDAQLFRDMMRNHTGRDFRTWQFKWANTILHGLAPSTSNAFRRRPPSNARSDGPRWLPRRPGKYKAAITRVKLANGWRCGGCLVVRWNKLSRSLGQTQHTYQLPIRDQPAAWME